MPTTAKLTKEKEPIPVIHMKEACSQSIAAVRDTLYVLGGKWKLPIISALVGGPL